MKAFTDDIRHWAENKNGWIRLPLVIFFIYLFWGYWTQVEFWSVLDPLNLVLHEAGHLIFSYFNRTLMMFGGTLFQCLAPILMMWNFYRISDYFAMSLCLGWLSTNLFGIAKYIADARSLELSLVSLGQDADHDWNYLLSKFNLLQYDSVIASWVKGAAGLTMAVCIVSSLWMIWLMIKKLVLFSRIS